MAYPKSFQYFVYEYKPAGHSSSKNRKISVTQSSLYIKKNKFTNKNIKNYQSPKKNAHAANNFTKTFHKFIVHNKIDVPPRPYTAECKVNKELVNGHHTRILHPAPHDHHHRQAKKLPKEENFLKPWDNSAREAAENYF